MTKVKMLRTRRVRGVVLTVGKTYDVDPNDAGLLIAQRIAVAVGGAAVPESPVPELSNREVQPSGNGTNMSDAELEAAMDAAAGKPVAEPEGGLTTENTPALAPKAKPTPAAPTPTDEGGSGEPEPVPQPRPTRAPKATKAK